MFRRARRPDKTLSPVGSDNGVECHDVSTSGVNTCRSGAAVDSSCSIGHSLKDLCDTSTSSVFNQLRRGYINGRGLLVPPQVWLRRANINIDRISDGLFEAVREAIGPTVTPKLGARAQESRSQCTSQSTSSKWNVTNARFTGEEQRAADTGLSAWRRFVPVQVLLQRVNVITDRISDSLFEAADDTNPATADVARAQRSSSGECENQRTGATISSLDAGLSAWRRHVPLQVLLRRANVITDRISDRSFEFVRATCNTVDAAVSFCSWGRFVPLQVRLRRANVVTDRISDYDFEAQKSSWRIRGTWRRKLGFGAERSSGDEPRLTTEHSASKKRSFITEDPSTHTPRQGETRQQHTAQSELDIAFSGVDESSVAPTPKRRRWSVSGAVLPSAKGSTCSPWCFDRCEDASAPILTDAPTKSFPTKRRRLSISGVSLTEAWGSACSSSCSAGCALVSTEGSSVPAASDQAHRSSGDPATNMAEEQCLPSFGLQQASDIVSGVFEGIEQTKPNGPSFEDDHGDSVQSIMHCQAANDTIDKAIPAEVAGTPAQNPETCRPKRSKKRRPRPGFVCEDCMAPWEGERSKWFRYSICRCLQPSACIAFPPESLWLHDDGLRRELRDTHRAKVRRGELPRAERRMPRCEHGRRLDRCGICSGCEHGRPLDRCRKCRPCPHGHVPRNCKVCGACSHGNVRDRCNICSGCIHGLARSGCRICRACEHGRLRSGCVLCHSCPHGRLPQNCITCRGCEHGKLRSFCDQCNRCEHGMAKPTCGVCRGCAHGLLFRFCRICAPCPHGRRKAHCAECSGCAHGLVKDDCRVCSGCPHGRVRRFCGTCNPCPHGKRKQACKDCSACPHGAIRDSCARCKSCPHGKVPRFCKLCSGCPHARLPRFCKICVALHGPSGVADRGGRGRGFGRGRGGSRGNSPGEGHGTFCGRSPFLDTIIK